MYPDGPSEKPKELTYKSIPTTYKYFYKIEISKPLIPKKFPWQKIPKKVHQLGRMKKHFKTLTNSVITSTMQHQQDTNQLNPIKRLQEEISELLQRVKALETPTLMYRPPEGEKHIKVAEYLDSIDERLRKLEENAHRAPTVYLDDINTPSL